MSFSERLKNIGPGAMVAAAFIGPGTVTTSTIAGARFGYTLLWAMLFSSIATMVLQEMSARLGLATKEGLGEALRNQFQNTTTKYLAVAMVIGAIFIGNAAYQTGNILGGALGLETITGISRQIWGPIIGVIAFVVLWQGHYKLIERTLIALVATMSVAFVVTAIVIKPDFAAILSGLFIPSVPDLTLTIALIGTTVVPYNLFLHASAVSKRWENIKDLKEARIDTILSILVGGIISMAIIITASVAFHGTGAVPANAGEMATQLTPLLGEWAKWFFALGLFAAGFSSAVTAPLAGAFAGAGALGWGKDMASSRFRTMWLIILLVGIIGSAAGRAPLAIIIFAQAANGILLPIVAIFLLVIMNNKKILREHVNKTTANVLGILVVGVAIILGARGIYLAISRLL